MPKVARLVQRYLMGVSARARPDLRWTRWCYAGSHGNGKRVPEGPCARSPLVRWSSRGYPNCEGGGMEQICLVLRSCQAAATTRASSCASLKRRGKGRLRTLRTAHRHYQRGLVPSRRAGRRCFSRLYGDQRLRDRVGDVLAVSGRVRYVVKRRLADCTGVDLNSPEMTLPELLSSYSAEQAVA